METRSLAGNDVRLPDPTPGIATVIQRYSRERAVLIHPSDFRRLNELEQLLSEAATIPAAVATSVAVGAHIETDTPSDPIVDPARLDELFPR